MKDAVRYYLKYGILTTTVWGALNALGLMPDNPYGSWLQDLTTIWLTGVGMALAVVYRPILCR